LRAYRVSEHGTFEDVALTPAAPNPLAS
jgi:hypothetical protein